MAGSSPGQTQHVVVMGVAGVGKSTIAQRLAADLDLDLAEGDDSIHGPTSPRCRPANR